MKERRRLPRFARAPDREGGVLFLAAAGRRAVGGIGAKIASEAASARIEARLDPCPGFLAASAEHR